jgi:rRNA small subunit pseudouridine methyltransferase Nep1
VYQRKSHDFLTTLYIALSWNATKVRLYKYFNEIPDGVPVVVSVGAMAKGPDSFADDYVDEKIGKEIQKEQPLSK